MIQLSISRSKDLFGNLFGVSFWIYSTFHLAIILSIIAHSKSDSRCFLQNGGSSVSFFVAEDAPIGWNLGALEIQGDVTNDIVLSLRESTSPIRIEPGTKNLTLTKRLDKEGVEGPSSASFTVLCSRKRDNNEPIQVPVMIRVLDINDNKPKWIGGPYSINVSEQTVVGSTIMNNLKAIDLDHHGPHSTLSFSALDADGKLSKMVSFSGGGLEGRIILNRPLDYESTPQLNVTLRVKDHGNPPLYSDTYLLINVFDSDDQNPRFKYVSYSSLLPTNPKKGFRLKIEPEDIAAFDQDTGINAKLKFSMPEGRESDYFRMDPISGIIRLTRDIPEDQLNQPITLVLKAEQIDNKDRYSLSTLHVGKQGNHFAPLHFVQKMFEINIPENSPPKTILLTALTSRPSDKNLRFTIEGNGQDIFQIGPLGQLFLKRFLDYEKQQKHSFKIWVNDGYQNASSTVTVNVLNVNDWAPRFRKSLYEFNISSDSIEQGVAVGQIEVADGDLGDSLSLEIKNTDSIHIDTFGRLFIRNKTLMKREMMFLVVARDTGDPPREAFVPVVLRFSDMARSEEVLVGEFSIKFALISALSMVGLALIVGIMVYFGYCRKRRKIQSESFQKRVLERNMSNPLAIHKISQPNTLRRSNKIKNMPMNISAPLTNLNDAKNHRNKHTLTPVDPIITGNGFSTATIRPKNVTWSPKIIQRVTPTPPNRNGITKVTTNANHNHTNSVNINNNGYEIDPETSVTPLENYRPNKSDTLQSNSSLTLYF